ncbi:hypothetical protein Poli38472_006770 [Pythium oligandrum]|uniref:CCT domain-containing protein n=1 Tax=Pythium oligandrum TaxID=41045 RepID=A0A8K1FB03_PYTOL|nr:hypothetical protein Poli38472_006770 [Pythium oligandrum]|eukprot:TMW56760.1 hypothetical protein Poli38472_006770 [Pythium oligandrum]
MSARVFVRLYDGQSQREGEEELLMLPPPPLTWPGVVAAMIGAVTKQDHEPDEQAIGQARLFLLPTDPQGIVAELNARSLRFGIRDNDKFAICLHGEEYVRPSAGDVGVTNEAAATYASLLPPMNVSMTKLNDHSQYQEQEASGPPRGNIMQTNAPPGGQIMMGDGSMGGSSRKGSKRVRSISGKMAAIKSLGDKGLISAEDRGHLKDLLLNNDSPALQEALDRYQSTGDFQAVKDLLMKELQNPSAKRGNTGDWLPESLINDISMNFQTHDVEPTQRPEDSSYGRYGGQQQTPPANPFMYTHGDAHPATSPHAANGVSHDYGVGAEPEPYDQRQMSWANTAASVQAGNMYGHHPHMGMQPAQPGMYPPQMNMAMRNRRPMEGSPMNQPPHHHPMMPTGPEMGYGVPAHPHHQASGYPMAPGYPAMGYGAAPPATPYDSRMGMNPYGMMPSPHMSMGYNPYHAQQQAYSMPQYGYGGMPAAPGMQAAGYDYYGAGYGYGKNQARAGGKWTTAPPMPSYPPPCSKEEKKEKIARWLKKREHRNWSNKPSYPVRHNIAKNRKRGEDGRFITKARLAEMAAEEAARGGGAGGDEEGEGSDGNRDSGSGSDELAVDAGTTPLGVLDTNVLNGLPQATAVQM